MNPPSMIISVFLESVVIICRHFRSIFDAISLIAANTEKFVIVVRYISFISGAQIQESVESKVARNSFNSWFFQFSHAVIGKDALIRNESFYIISTKPNLPAFGGSFVNLTIIFPIFTCFSCSIVSGSRSMTYS